MDDLIAKNERRLAVMKINSKKYYEAHKEARIAQIKAYQANNAGYQVYKKEYHKEYYKKQRAKLLEAREQQRARETELKEMAKLLGKEERKEGWLNTQKNYTLKNHYPLEAIETKLKEALEAIEALKT